MFDPKTLDDLSRRLAGMFPPSARALQQDLEKNLRVALSAAFAKLDLVTREEFDVQTAVLDRTRTKLKALEQRVARLETPDQGGEKVRAEGEFLAGGSAEARSGAHGPMATPASGDPSDARETAGGQ